MKKIFIVMTVLFLALFCCCSCSDFIYDSDFAYVEITTDGGFSKVKNAEHGKNLTVEKERQANALKQPVRVTVAEGETVNIHFHCNECGYDEVIEEVVGPVAKLFSCECSGEPGTGSMKEYIAVEVEVSVELNDNEGETIAETTVAKTTTTKTTTKTTGTARKSTETTAE